MADTTRLALPLISESQAQKHVTHNEALQELDGLVPGRSGNGAYMTLEVAEEDVTLSGASTESTISFPAGSIILGAGVRVITEITGATDYDLGPTGGTVDDYGGALGLAVDSTNKGVVGPAANYSPLTATFTANGGSFTAGVVRLALYYLEMNLPEGD